VDQLKRASISVAANISEGYGRNTKKDFGQFLSMALGSVNEVITYLDFLQLEFKMPTTTIQEHYYVLSKRIYSFRRYLLTSK
jgi:four helix bundle protein